MKITRLTYLLVLLNCAVPALLLGWDAIQGQLGSNPVNFAIRTTGLLALLFLVSSLAITPIIRLSSASWLGQFRRVAGLYAFFHTAVHFLLFFLLDRAGNVADTVSEIFLRPYLAIGAVGLVIMVPLAVTSTDGMIRWLGPKRWKLLHRLAYVAAIAGVTHYYLLVKADTTWPLIYAAVLAVLLAYRAISHYLGLVADSRKLRASPPPSTTAARKPRAWSGQLRVAKIFVETPEVRTFRLVPVQGSRLPFEHLPGQYLNLALPIEGRPVRRSYTIASPPTRGGYCEVTIKREERGLA
ncbi:MAG: ferric reductase-like transmembrane domain-containing protein, partial [Pirellulaceae bacterium]|nr:ferric reductase-like transmembrane domain-containing protein [Pirellulaceae bacterium]